jgi:hypothetical protein
MGKKELAKRSSKGEKLVFDEEGKVSSDTKSVGTTLTHQPFFI